MMEYCFMAGMLGYEVVVELLWCIYVSIKELTPSGIGYYLVDVLGEDMLEHMWVIVLKNKKLTTVG